MSKFISLRIRCEHEQGLCTFKNVESQAYDKYLYIKEHSTKSKNIDASKNQSILFVANLSSYWTAEDVASLLSRYGTVTNSEIGRVQTCRFCTVEYEKASSLKKALKKLAKLEKDQDSFISENEFVKTSKLEQKSFFDRFLSKRPDKTQLKFSIDNYMAQFKKEEEAERERQEKQVEEVDSEGFTKVTYRKAAKRKDVEATQEEREERAKSKRRNRKKKQEKELTNFYRFQRRKEKEDKLVELRKKFEQDKEIIAKLKAARKFRPY